MSGAAKYVLALDQGTTSSRAILFGRDGRSVATAQQEFPQIFPAPGEVEHDPEAIWSSQLGGRARVPREGEHGSGGRGGDRHHQPARDDRAVGPQHRQAGGERDRVAEPGQRADLRRAEGRRPRPSCSARETGLVVDAYFSGTKVKHLLDTVPGLRARAEAGDILFGTVDTFLIWRLTGGRRHVTDVSNASRTLMFDIHTLDWDDELLRLLGVPRRMLPEVTRVERGVRRDRSVALRRRHQGCRRRRRPAGGAVRPGLLRAGRRQEHLRHRLLHAAQHRQGADRLAQRPADDDRLAGERRSDVLPRRLGVRRRRGGAVAARRAAAPSPLQPRSRSSPHR